jgi:hypothetical protein
MQYVRSPQCIVGSGECGSGKSYAMGMVLKLLIERSRFLSEVEALDQYVPQSTHTPVFPLSFLSYYYRIAGHDMT